MDLVNWKCHINVKEHVKGTRKQLGNSQNLLEGSVYIPNILFIHCLSVHFLNFHFGSEGSLKLVCTI